MSRYIQTCKMYLNSHCKIWSLIVLCLLLCSERLFTSQIHAQQIQLQDVLQSLVASVPKKPLQFTKQRTEITLKKARLLDKALSESIVINDSDDPKVVLQKVELFLQTHSRVTQLFNRTFKQRSIYSQHPASPSRRKAVRQFIRTTAILRDLSGRIRYATFTLIDRAGLVLSTNPKDLLPLVDLLLKYESSIGAAVMAEYLKDPQENNPQGLQPIPASLKRRILKLIAKTKQYELLDHVLDVVRSSRNSSELKLLAALTIRIIGLPQDPLVTNDPLVPQPVVTATSLYKIVLNLKTTDYSAATLTRHKELLAWLTKRIKQGITEPYYQLGRYQVRPGDWMLMRNPSPYNLFTDLSPGLFTHVGVVTEVITKGGKRHIVIIDMPERGTTIPAINVEGYVKRTLDYMFLRHHDEKSARKMAAVANAVIGNPALFDLNFRSSRLAALKGKKLQGKQITTYCAGLLLLCAQETKYHQREYFPLKEVMAGGNTSVNLAKLGITFGENFISPTGPLFSPRLSIAAQREPMYSPSREIEQAVYRHFASRLISDRLQPTANAYHDLRLKLAEASKSNPLLKRALARAVNISKDMDLVSAAKTAAVVETMDDIAYQQSDLYELAEQAFELIDFNESELAQMDKKELEELKKLQQVHAQLFSTWQKQKLSPRQLRIKLVKYYIQQGKRMIDQRFYQAKK